MNAIAKPGISAIPITENQANDGLKTVAISAIHGIPKYIVNIPQNTDAKTANLNLDFNFNVFTFLICLYNFLNKYISNL